MKDIDLNKLSKEELINIISVNEKLLDNEKALNKVLTDKVALLETEVKQLNLEKEELIKKIENIGYQVDVQKKVIFGSKSEQSKYLIDKDFIFNEVEEETSLDVDKELYKKEKKKKKVGRKKDTQNYEGLLNVETQYKVIETDETICPNCGTTLVSHSDETYTKLIHVPEKFIKLIITFKRKRCPKCDYISKKDDVDIFGKSLLSNSLASYLVSEKYLKGVPSYRLESILESGGVKLSRQLQANYLINVASELYPIYEKMKEDLINTNCKVLHADETTLKVIKNDDNRKVSYMWLYGTSEYDPSRILIYEYKLDRKGKNPKEFLNNYQGYLVCDGYSGYNNIPNVKLARCFFHARKKFAEIIPSNAIKDINKSISNKAVNIIKKAFYYEDKYKEDKLSPIEIYKRRQLEVKPIIDEYFNLLENTYPSSCGPLKKGIEYSLDLKEDLYRFLDDGHIPMTNNLAERAIKPFVINRKNFLFAYTEKGADASAILMSIVQTARNNLLQVDKYIEYVLSKISTTKQSDIDSLLPYSDKLPSEIKIKFK